MVAEKKVGEIYTHVDNGGYTFSVYASQHEDGEFAGARIKIEDWYFGYSRITKVTPDNLEKIGRMFFEAASRIRDLQQKF